MSKLTRKGQPTREVGRDRGRKNVRRPRTGPRVNIYDARLKDVTYEDSLPMDDESDELVLEDAVEDEDFDEEPGTHYLEEVFG